MGPLISFEQFPSFEQTHGFTGGGTKCKALAPLPAAPLKFLKFLLILRYPQVGRSFCPISVDLTARDLRLAFFKMVILFVLFFFFFDIPALGRSFASWLAALNMHLELWSKCSAGWGGTTVLIMSKIIPTIWSALWSHGPQCPHQSKPNGHKKIPMKESFP